MSSIASPPEDNDPDRDALQEASNIIESESANVKIEIEFNKAVRVGTLLRLWRDLMVNDENVGSSFPADWVDHAAMDIFHNFFPPTMDEVQPYFEPDDDED